MGPWMAVVINTVLALYGIGSLLAVNVLRPTVLAPDFQKWAYGIASASIACAALGWWRLWRIRRHVELSPRTRHLMFWRARGWSSAPAAPGSSEGPRPLPDPAADAVQIDLQ